VSESVVSTAEVLLIEGKRASKRASFATALSRRYTIITAHTGKQALEAIEKSVPDIIVLNAATTRTSGHRICVTIRQFSTEIPIIHIQKQGSPRSKSPADILLNMPFTPRKLFNRIDRFIAAKDGEMLKTGPFQMNLKSRILTTKNGEQRLTPKLAKLMELFMRQPNEVLERGYLMEHVWQTDYLGDTRTLDVHIRWIREAIEEKPSKPIFLRTIRGKGYLLDLVPVKNAKKLKSP
jgi:DNA-binding response OmpR family regulator